LAIDRLNRMTALGMLALALVERGDTAEALRVLDEVVPQAVQFRIPQMHGLFLAFQGEARLQAGDLAGAHDLAARGETIAGQAGYRYALGWAQRVRSRIARAAGDRSEAARRLEQAIATFDGMGAPFEAARTRVEFAELLAQGHPTQARCQAQAGLAGLLSLQLTRHSARVQALLEQIG
jgi:hypothetical protein